jgi:hypothetical protein
VQKNYQKTDIETRPPVVPEQVSVALVVEVHEGRGGWQEGRCRWRMALRSIAYRPIRGGRAGRLGSPRLCRQ